MAAAFETPGKHSMPRSFAAMLALLTSLVVSLSSAHGQTPTTDTEAAARELVTTMKLTDQFMAVMPALIKTMKPAIVQNRPDVDRDFDAITPTLMQGMAAHLDEFANAVVAVYVSNFTAEELRAATAFYRTPAGQKFLAKNPLVMQQTMVLGQKIGQSIGADIRQKMIDELRKKGHAI